MVGALQQNNVVHSEWRGVGLEGRTEGNRHGVDSGKRETEQGRGVGSGKRETDR